ncbi:hypothetical protein GCM10010247_67640 [Streptomyces calvus]|nr:hypothetical protein GCM10010247_67640 [Streptomyces calvus]
MADERPRGRKLPQRIALPVPFRAGSFAGRTNRPREQPREALCGPPTTRPGTGYGRDGLDLENRFTKITGAGVGPGRARRSAPARGAAWWGRTGQRQQLHATLRRAGVRAVA